MRIVLRTAVAAVLAVLALPVSELAAQECAGAGSRSVVCRVDLYGAPAGERLQALDGSERIYLAAGQEFELAFDAIDQFGRRFPPERLAYGMDLGEECSRLVEIRELEVGRYQVRAGRDRGACALWIWLPGNLNLEWPLHLEVGARERSGYTRVEAEYLATRLYAAMLGREPDAEGLRDTTAEIQRGNLAGRLRVIVDSPEYRNRRSSMSATAVLEQVYLGLLGRAPDSYGVQRFLGAVERWETIDVVWELVRSEEFEDQLLAATP